MKYSAILSLSAFLAILVAGCGSGERLLPISGNVSFQGKPIEKGVIEFVPVDGTQGPSMGGSIKDGHYAVPRTHGARENGTYQVRITAMKKTGKTIPNIMVQNGPPMELEDNYIPAKYNRESTLKTTVTPEVASKGIDFQLS